jgi:hypothetical protein
LQRRNDKTFVLAGELSNFLCVVRGLGQVLGLDPERGARPGNSGADLDAPLGLDHGGRLSRRQPAELHDRGRDTV